MLCMRYEGTLSITHLQKRTASIVLPQVDLMSDIIRGASLFAPVIPNYPVWNLGERPSMEDIFRRLEKTPPNLKVAAKNSRAKASRAKASLIPSLDTR